MRKYFSAKCEPRETPVRVKKKISSNAFSVAGIHVNVFSPEFKEMEGSVPLYR